MLVIDSDENFLKLLHEESEALKGNLIPCSTGQAGQLRLADENQIIAAVFISIAIDSAYFYSVLKLCVLHRYGTPIFVLYEDPECPISPEELERIGVSKSLRKPVTYQQMMDSIGFSERQITAVNPEAKNHDALDQEAAGRAEDFHPIRAESFIAGQKSLFNLYVKLGSGKFVKILHGGESFDRSKVTEYIKKGVSHFYIRQDAQVKYLDYCNQLLTRLLSHARVPVSIKAEQAFNYAEQTIALVRNYGLNEESLSFCKDTVVKVQTLIESLERVDSPMLKMFFKNAVAFEHGVGTAIFANLIARSAPFFIDRKADIVILTGMLHDIGLYTFPEEFHREDETRTPEQEIKYRTHPSVGAEILRKIDTIPEIVIQAVKQHHERCTPKGFPSQIVRGQSNVVAEAVGLSDEFLRFLKSDLYKSNDGKSKIAALNEILNGFTPAIREVFKSVFIKPHAS